MNISESIMHSEQKFGAHINLSRKLRNDELLFGECQSVIIITIEEKDLHKLITMANENNVYTQTIGKVTLDDKLIINDMIDISRDELEEAYFNSLEKIMSK